MPDEVFHEYLYCHHKVHEQEELTDTEANKIPIDFFKNHPCMLLYVFLGLFGGYDYHSKTENSIGFGSQPLHVLAATAIDL